MAPDPASTRRSVSPESSGRDSPIPRQWRNQLGGAEDHLLKDKTFRRYAALVDKALALFETALEEWADYISFLNRLLKALQARPSSITAIPSRALVAKRLSQCLTPSLPSGVHQRALEVYHYVFSTIGKDGLSRDLPLYLPGLASVLSFASLSVRSPYLDLVEHFILRLDPRSLRPAMKAIILALLPGLEDETAEDFDRTLKLVASFKEAIRPVDSELLTDDHATGDDYFWQCFFLACITSPGRRPGGLAYLVKHLPAQGGASIGPVEASVKNGFVGQTNEAVAAITTSPEPGLLIRCFASGLLDDQLLIQRGFLDLLVTHLPLSSNVLQQKVKPGDLELLLKAAVGVVIRRDMSLNRRLWAWFLGPESPGGDADQILESPTTPADHHQSYLSSRTNYFERFGLQPLTRALLGMIENEDKRSPTERARPYRICLSLMDRWEIGGLVIPEVFLPIIENVHLFQDQASSRAEFAEVLRSASVFFDGIESGLIYSELISLLAQALGPSSATVEVRKKKLATARFILTNFNVREEEMVTVHAPLSCLATLGMLQDLKERSRPSDPSNDWVSDIMEAALTIAITLLDLVPQRAFPESKAQHKSKKSAVDTMSNAELLKRIQDFYVNEQGNIEAAPPPFSPSDIGELILHQTVQFVRNGALPGSFAARLLILALAKMPSSYTLDIESLMTFLRGRMESAEIMPFSHFSPMVQLSIELQTASRISLSELSGLASRLVPHAWSYLAAPEPKYHVETVRCLWELQAALSLSNRDIEASLASLVVADDNPSSTPQRRVENGHTFSVLWSHTLQDNPSDRRGSKLSISEAKAVPRLAGMDHFEIMLTRPLFLILDSLTNNTTQHYMTVKSWLNNMTGIDRLFLLFVYKLSDINFLSDLKDMGSEKFVPEPKEFSGDDDVDLCLYYLRSLSNVLSACGDVAWAVLASKHVSTHGQSMHISSGGEESEMTLQEFFMRVCLRCVTADSESEDQELEQRVSQLHRFALGILHQFLLSQHGSTVVSHLSLENVFLDRLWKSIGGADPYVQVLLLDVVYDALKLRDASPAELPATPPSEKRNPSIDPSRASRPSLSMSDARPNYTPPPPLLLKCLQAALSSNQSRQVLDSWIAFFAECLPFYADSIFQVLIPLVETLCKQIGSTFGHLRDTFRSEESPVVAHEAGSPESSLIYLLNGLEQVLARAHDQLLSEEARAQLLKNPDQPQSLFGSMVSGVFQSDGHHSRSATANDRLTVHLAFQDATRMCYRIWSWGLGEDASQQGTASLATFHHTSLRMRNRARRLLEHLFTVENLECLETVIDIWRNATTPQSAAEVFNLLSALEASRPRHSIPALFNSIYSRTNPGALEPSRRSTMTISLEDSNLVTFLVEYTRSLDDDAMDEIWQDCIVFLKDLLSNPFPHRQNLPSLLEFAAILGEKVDNTNFGEQRKMRRELGDLFLRLLTALFTTRPITLETANMNGSSEKLPKIDGSRRSTAASTRQPEDVVGILASIVPNLSKILVETDRVLSAAGTISTNVIGPTFRSKSFPDTVNRSTLSLLHELSRLQNNQKTWKKDVGEAFNDSRFFSMNLALVEDGWLPLLRQWAVADKEKMSDIVSRINAPTTAGIVFGVGATSARLEADRKTQVNLRRMATLVLASAQDAFVSDLPIIFDKLVEILAATSTSSPSSTTRADVYMLLRALILKVSPIHLAMLWPIVNTELHAAISSVVAPDNSNASDMYTNLSILQACKLLDLLVCVAPDDFQLHEWLFITDTIDAVYRYSTTQPVALVDELSEELGRGAGQSMPHSEAAAHLTASSTHRRPLIGAGGISDEVSIERKDELVAKILRPFFGQLSIYAFESTYAMGDVDNEACLQGLLRDLFDERTIARAL